MYHGSFDALINHEIDDFTDDDEATCVAMHRNLRSCNQHFVENIVSFYDDKTFQEHFRFTRSGVEDLVRKLASLIDVNDGPGRPPISLEKSILSVIWL